MLARAEVRAVDTTPGQLRVSTQVGLLPAVVSHRVDVGGLRLELRILAASHQVVVGEHVETVACELTVPSAEPVGDGRVYDLGAWQMVASVERCGRDDFGARARDWIVRGRKHESCVTVRFPNHRHAITALAVDVAGPAADEQVGWTGVHLYPDHDGGGGVVVHTTTRRIVPADSGPGRSPGQKELRT